MGKDKYYLIELYSFRYLTLNITVLLLGKLTERLKSAKIKLQLNMDPPRLAVSKIFHLCYAIYQIYSLWQPRIHMFTMPYICPGHHSHTIFSSIHTSIRI